MGKRSDFARIPRDFYRTPREAVVPLIAHLPFASTFLEPCAGDGALVEHLTGVGHALWDAFDIEPQAPQIKQADAMDTWRTGKLDGCDYIITNPPWGQKVLHPMIEHFSAMRPTWLLFDADWMHTKQSAPYMPWLRKVVSVGRVKWIPGSKMTGKDNCAWHLFDQQSEGQTVFVGRAA